MCLFSHNIKKKTHTQTRKKKCNQEEQSLFERVVHFTHAFVHTLEGGNNLFRLAVYVNYCSQPQIIAGMSVAVKNKLKQFHLAGRETNTVASLALCSVKAFNQALVYFLFVYYVIVRT